MLVSLDILGTSCCCHDNLSGYPHGDRAIARTYKEPSLWQLLLLRDLRHCLYFYGNLRRWFKMLLTSHLCEFKDRIV